MLNDIIKELNIFLEQGTARLPMILLMLAILWAVYFLNTFFLKSKLKYYVLTPRTLHGLIGIITMPLVHANFNHIFFNSIPFFALGLFILTLGVGVFFHATITIWLLTGILTWLFAGRGRNMGASGLISGYFGFILGIAYQQPGLTTILLAAVALYYFGSILISVLPNERDVSWEGHLFGILSGLITLAMITNNFLNIYY